VIPETERAYLAGILDGEGCLGIYKIRRKYYITKIQVTNTRLKLLKWLQDRFGGNIYTSKDPRSNRKQVWNWTVAAKKAAIVAEAALPYLLLKRLQAEAIIKLQATRLNHELRRDIKDRVIVDNPMSTEYSNLYEKLKILNMRGSNAPN